MTGYFGVVRTYFKVMGDYFSSRYYSFKNNLIRKELSCSRFYPLGKIKRQKVINTN